MKSPKNLLLAVLIAATLGLSGLAWQQYLELIALRGANLSDNERADWQRRLAALEKRKNELEGQLAAAQGKSGEQTDAAKTAAGDLPSANARGGGRRGGGPAFAQIRALMDSPQFQKMAAAQQRSALDGQYAGLFKKLSLSPPQLDQFKNLLLDKQNTVRDVLSAAQDQGIDIRQNRDSIQSMIQDSQTEIDNSIQTVLGAADYTQYQQYEQTQPQRNLVAQLQRGLSYTSDPLSDGQSEQLVQLFAQTTTPSANGTFSGVGGARFAAGAEGGGPGPAAVGLGGPGGGRGLLPLANAPVITGQTISQAQGILSTPQVQALVQLQQQQQEQQQAAQILQKTLGGATSNSGAGQAPATGNTGNKGG